MRAGGPNCMIQQHSLTPEAVAVIKQAVTLAKTRGHSQVTPLHVASTMLSSNPTNNNVNALLRTACLRSHSHPLHCRALELCLNVALNRLPAMSGVHYGDNDYGTAMGSRFPSVSNALVAAFKRAQAHQRRGSIENQPHVLVTKIELDQLVISILDDPSVSRVMKEAGFSSAQIKSNVEREVYSRKNDSELDCPGIRSEDVEYVIGNLVKSRRKSIVVVGESLGSVEGVVKRVMEKIENGEVPHNLRGLRVLDILPTSFQHLTKDELDQKIKEIKNRARSCTSNDDSGLILHFGGLNEWITALEKISPEYSSAPLRLSPQKEWSPIQHIAMEMGRLIHVDCDDEHNPNIWLIGFGNFHCYQKSKNSGNPSLGTLWGLHPLNIERRESELDSNSKIKEIGNESCWLDLLPADVNKEGRRSSFNALPPWLQQYKDEVKITKDNQVYDKVMDDYTSPLSFKHSEFLSLPPSPSTNSDFSSDHQQHNHDWPLTRRSRRSIDFAVSNSTPNSTSSSDDVEFIADYAPRLMELNAENLKTLCQELEVKFPSQKDVTIPKIASTILRCRSGMLKRKWLSLDQSGGRAYKKDTWMVFSGDDEESKQKMARELARVVFGSYSSFISFSAGEPSEDGETSRKRLRDGKNLVCFERFTEAVRSDPHRVFFIEDEDEVDSCSQMGFKKSMETGKVKGLLGGEVSIGDAIIIMSRHGRRCLRPIGDCHSPSKKTKETDGKEKEGNGALLDLNRAIEDEEFEGHTIGEVGLLGCVDEEIIF